MVNLPHESLTVTSLSAFYHPVAGRAYDLREQLQPGTSTRLKSPEHWERQQARKEDSQLARLSGRLLKQRRIH